MRCSTALTVAAFVGVWAAQSPAQVEVAVGQLHEAQDRGELDVATVVAALRQGGDAGRAAAAIVRHEWLDVPAELLDAAAGHPASATLLLRELALAPRPSVQAWARTQVERDDLPNDVRCYAIAAAQLPATGKVANLLVDTALDPEGGDGYRTAAWLMASRDADRLLGRLHAAALQQQAEFDRLLPFFDRLSPRGHEHLVGLALSLPNELQQPLVRYFLNNDVAAYRDRSADALDGKLELEPIWLARAAELLTERSRVERLFGVLDDETASAELRDAAFRALLEASVIEPPVVDYAGDAVQRSRDIRALLDAGVGQLPVDTILHLLTGDVRVAALTASALLRRDPLEPAIEAQLVELLADVVPATPTLPLVVALLRRGSEGSVRAIWPRLRGSELFDQCVDILARREAAWISPLLLEDLAHDVGDEESLPARRQRDRASVRLALVRRGDRRELDRLVEGAATSSPSFLRRCTHHAAPVGVEHSLTLLEFAGATADDDLAVELISWAATTDDPQVHAALFGLWQPAELTERHIAALSGLGHSAARPRLVTELRAAIEAGTRDDRAEMLAYELISTMRMPLAQRDIELLAELALVWPLADPERERGRAQRWSDGRNGFPLAAAIAHRLRGADPELVHAVFGRTAQAVQEHSEFAAFAPQRLLVMWRALVPDQRVQSALGRATAALLLAANDPMAVGHGPASLYASQEREARGEFAAAVQHARRAVALLLRQPDARRDARLFLGERDPVAGVDPWSRLAARPFVLEARACLAARNDPGAGAALRAAAELVGHDADGRATIEELTRASKR